MMKVSIGLCILILLSCRQTPKGNDKSNSSDTTNVEQLLSSYPFPYDMRHPDNKWKVPKALTEISDIDQYKKHDMVSVQDEVGTLFIYNLKKDEVSQKIDFAKDGDFEGLCNVNDTVWVINSNGTLYRVTDIDQKLQQTTKYKTFLTEDNDCEGLCYDAQNRRLLVACKKKPGIAVKGVRAVYAFDLQTNTLQPEPVYLIKLDEIKSFLLQTDKQKLVTEEFKNLFDPQKDDVSFQPSEIAINPLSNDIYVISTVGKALVVMNRDGTIVYISSLDPDIFKQPEGLTFLDDGTMYISDEGRSGKGNIMEFKYQSQAK